MAVAKRPTNRRARDSRSNRSVPASEPVARVSVIGNPSGDPVIAGGQDFRELQYQPRIPAHHDPAFTAGGPVQDDFRGTFRRSFGEAPELLVPLIRIGHITCAVGACGACDVGLHATGMNARHKQIRVQVLCLERLAETADRKFCGVVCALCRNADHAENGG